MEEHVSLDYMFFIRWLLMAMEEHVSLDYLFFILWLLMAMEEHASLDYMFFILWLLMAMEEHVSLDYLFFILVRFSLQFVCMAGVYLKFLPFHVFKMCFCSIFVNYIVLKEFVLTSIPL